MILLQVTAGFKFKVNLSREMRYKPILVEEGCYLVELVRYVVQLRCRWESGKQRRVMSKVKPPMLRLSYRLLVYITAWAILSPGQGLPYLALVAHHEHIRLDNIVFFENHIGGSAKPPTLFLGCQAIRNIPNNMPHNSLMLQRGSRAHIIRHTLHLAVSSFDIGRSS